MEWIKVDQLKPEPKTDVLAYDGDECFVLYYDSAGRFYNLDTDTDQTKNVTHWMPLPEPPKTESK